jgi:F-type H+-transporting ATPase subunit alpha
MRQLLKQEAQQPLAPPCQVAWLVAFNDGRFAGLSVKALEEALQRLFAGAASGALTLDDSREDWSAAVAGWLRAEGA